MRHQHDLPRLPGAPFLGNLIPFLRDPIGCFRDGYAALGPAFGLRVPGKRMAVFAGQKYHEEFFGYPDEQLSGYEPAAALRYVSGDVGFPPDRATHRRLQRAMTPLVAPDALERYEQWIRSEVRAAVASLGEQGELDVVPFFSDLLLRISVRFILGAHLRGTRMDELSELYWDIAESLSIFLPPQLPIPRHRRRDRALRKLRDVGHAAIAERLKTREDTGDALLRIALLAEESDWTEDDVCSFLVFLVFGTHLPTSIFSTWSLVLAAEHPDIASRLRECELMSTEALVADSYVDNYLREVERCRPAVPYVIRYARTDLTIGGYHIRRGSYVALCSLLSHRDPEVFRDPDRFDPDRFTPPRSEGANLKYPLIGFGAGAHACMGRALAKLELKIVLAELISAYDFELVTASDPDPKHFLFRPRASCRVAYRRRQPLAMCA